ncbi:30S ribosomal protein S8 [bacterium]|nr:30S ribosomal protein S8 [bacterium]
MSPISNPVGDMMNRMKVAGISEKEAITLPYSRFRFAVAEVLVAKGFAKNVSKKGKKVVKGLEIGIAYHTDGQPKISDVRHLSNPGKRVYRAAKDIRTVRHGYGLLVLSTPRGIMAGADAKKEKIGGEALFEVW